LAPNHVSIAEPDALAIIYAHGNGALKSDFYDAFVSIRRGVFNTRDRNEHTRKRKIVSHIFSQRSVVEFEPQIRSYVATFIRQWDRLSADALKGMSGREGEGWTGRDGRLWLDCLPCMEDTSLICTMFLISSFGLQGQTIWRLTSLVTLRSAHLLVCWKPQRIQPSFRKIKKM